MGGRGSATLSANAVIPTSAVILAPTSAGIQYILKMKNFVRWVLSAFSVACVVALVGSGIFRHVSAAPAGPDLTFGTNGTLVSISPNGGNQHSSTTVFQNGKFAVTNTCGALEIQSVCISGFDLDGKPDAAFGVDGVATLGRAKYALSTLGHPSLPYFYVLAACGTVGSCITKINSHGSVDSSFGNAGWRDVNSAAPTHFAQWGAAASDGTFVTIAPCFNGQTRGLCFARWSGNGQLNTAFGLNGIAFKELSDAFLNAAVIAEDGSIFAAGACRQQINGYSFFKRCIVKLLASGEIDAEFGVNGLVTSNQYEGSEWITDMLLDRSNRIVATVSSFASGANFGCRFGCNLLVRLLQNGQADTEFLPHPPLWELGADAISSDSFGRHYVISGANCETELSNCFGRLLPDGRFDPTFSVDMRQSPLFTAEPGVSQYRNFRYWPVSDSPRANRWQLVSSACQIGDAHGQCIRKLIQRAGMFDVDADGVANSESDGLLYLRYLLGFRDITLTSGALGTYADRTLGTDISNYLSTPNASYPNCSASIVGGPDGPSAMLDGIVLMRAMLGLTGAAVTHGIVFPAGTVRTTWADIKTHLHTNCGMAVN
jgi:hypothetical protein